MRTHLLRTTSCVVLSLAFGLACLPAIAASDASVVTRPVEPGQGKGDALVLPPPPATQVVIDTRDVTGSILATPTNAADAAPPAAPALSLDGGDPTLPAPAAATATPAPDSVRPATDAAIEPPVSSGPLTMQALDEALPAFVNATVVGDTRMQAEERRRVRQEVATFYAARADHLLWISGDDVSTAARAVMDRLDHASEDGLDLHGYAVAPPRDGTTAALIRTELALSEATLAYARQASGSRVDIARLGGIIDARPTVPDADAVLTSVPAAPDAGAALEAYNPIQPGYVALRDQLAQLRRRSGSEISSRIPAGRPLKLGMTDTRVPLIRARFGLGLSDDASGSSLVYDTKVAAAVAGFQRANGIPASGILTSRTTAALSGGNPSRLEGQLIANMEEWRWLPRTFTPDYIEVNIPEYKVRVFRDGQVMHETRVVVGQPDKPTPLFSQVMKFVIVNPYWNVPLSIIKKEMMPKLASDPNYFAEHGYEVVERGGQTYVRQPPGDSNALGRIKFMFPNSHAVYLHDTNARSFFQRDMRALSHGCVRVQDPFSFAEAVLGRDHGWSEARVKKLVGGNERTINLPEPLPIHIVYFTAFVDPDKGLQVRPDVYGYIGKIEAALDLPT